MAVAGLVPNVTGSHSPPALSVLPVSGQRPAVPHPLRVAPEHARRFPRCALLLDAPAPDVALAHHGIIQIDPVNVCGRPTCHLFLW
jgi:hypothetical protein